MKPRNISIARFCPGDVDTSGLAQERKTLHPASAALKKIGGTMPVDAAVRGLVSGIQRDEFMIIPGLKTKLTYWLFRLTPTSLWNGFTDSLVSRALENK
jgi:short-subunit dehydrogenase